MWEVLVPAHCSVGLILLSNPNSKIIIAGDINQLDIKDLTRHHAIQQIVKAPTRG